MQRRTLLLSIAGAACAPALADESGAWLVTADEALRYQGALSFEHNARPGTRSLALPAIELLQPVLDGNRVKAPFPIRLEFRAGNAPIVPSSFRILYGALNFDITSRVAQYARITPEGLSLDQAQVPAGKHRLLLQVSDERQRLAARELRFEVI